MSSTGLARAARERPGSVQEAAELLGELGRAGRTLCVRGGATKLNWGGRRPQPQVEVDTAGLNRMLEHNEGDFTAVLEAGVRLSEARERFAQAGQMLALDPPLGTAQGATIGGVLATADSGPLRHRYGAVRDLVLGVTVVLSDGTVAKAGGRVIKNVAGYDLGKVFAGSMGTLGMIATVAVRLHPLAPRAATAGAASDDPAALARAAGRLAALPIEADCLDVAWEEGGGAVLVRFGGQRALERAQSVAGRLRRLGLEQAEAFEEDAQLWEEQRARQRAASGGAAVKVAGLVEDLEAVLVAAVRSGATVASRAGLGLSWLCLREGEDVGARVGELRRDLPGATVTVLDGADLVDDPWPAPHPGAFEVMKRLKARFDPAHVFSPGSFVGGL